VDNPELMKKVIVVTGGNKGIGKEICHQLSKFNPESNIILTSRSIENGNNTLKEFQNLNLKNIEFHPLDVEDRTSIKELTSYISKKYSTFDVLINNAGVMDKGRLNEKTSTKTMQINYYGLKHVTMECLPLLNHHGRVVNVSGSLGEISNFYSESLKEKLLNDEGEGIQHVDDLAEAFLTSVKNNTAKEDGWRINCSGYPISKALVNKLTRILAKIHETNVRKLTFNSVCPGWVRTDLGGKNAPLSVEQGAETPVWLAMSEEVTSNGKFFRSKKEIPF
jgi:NAD(P)-dependent dehydrogenase (short-subunit alcohol dehydrogenase family)